MRDKIRRPSQGPRPAGPLRPLPPPSAARPAPKPALPSAIAPPPAPREAPGSDLLAQTLSGFGEATWDWHRIKAFTAARIDAVLAARGVPPDARSAPRLDIAIPAIEAMRYSPLKHEMAVLIASTMDMDRASEAHPAFIEIIKQLTGDEINLLAALPPAGQVLPMANVTYVDELSRVCSAIRHIVPERIARTCSARRPIPAYIDNLMRLSLIASPSNLGINDERHYRDLLTQPFIAAIEADTPLHLRAEIERRVILVTDFGDRFRRCCIDMTTLAD